MAVGLERYGEILVATVNNAPVNALSRVERAGLIDAVAASGVDGVRALVIIGAGDCFIAGADIREFGKPPIAPHLPDVVAAIENAPFPVIAAIGRQALGGGLEVALGCHYRIAGADAQLGLPEVTLGLVPGAGGTQRLPRLIDPLLAAEMVTTGKPMSAASALAAGLLDEVVDGDLLDAALRFAISRVDQEIASRRVSGRTVPAIDPEAFTRLETTTRKAARGAEAPLVALDLVRIALSTPFDQGIATERTRFLELREGDQARALRHIFFAERDAARPPADAADAVARPLERIGVVGAGTMGTGIAMSLADAGLPVTIVERSSEALAGGLARITEAYAGSVARGRITQDVADRRIKSVRGTTSYADLADADLIIEAAFETMAVKREVFSALDAIAKPGAVLASNTSYLDLDEIGHCTTRPADVVGLHYFSPANVMRLLEIVRGEATSPEVIRTALALAKRTGKQPVVAGVCNGFIGNRMLRAYTREAGLLLIKGATPTEVDTALTAFGMAMGPFAVADLAGIDIGYKARQAMAPGSFEPMATIIHDGLVEAGDLGRKTGRGFYLYEEGRPIGIENPSVRPMIASARTAAAIEPRPISDAEIVDRCILALAQEGHAILDEGIAARSGDIDVVYVNGYGFPRYRGGPLYYADQLPSGVVSTAYEKFAVGPFGHWWKPHANN